MLLYIFLLFVTIHYIIFFDCTQGCWSQGERGLLCDAPKQLLKWSTHSINKGVHHELQDTARNGTALDRARNGGLLCEFPADPPAAAHAEIRTVAHDVRCTCHGRIRDDEYATAHLRLSDGSAELQSHAPIHRPCRRCADLYGGLCGGYGTALSACCRDGCSDSGVSSALVDACRTDAGTA